MDGIASGHEDASHLLPTLLVLPLSASIALAQGAAAQHQVNAANAQVSVDILSDRGSVDLNPYLQHMVDALNQRWQPLLKEAAPASAGGHQTTVIGVTILPDGHLGAMKLVSSAHDEALNKAAWTAAKQDSFQPPPSLRDGPLKLRLNFIVN